MIWFWNEEEVYMGHSRESFNSICKTLTDNNIKYKSKVVDCSAGARGEIISRGSRLGENQAVRYVYYVYVHRRDYERARKML